jgi:hypothetical protein
MMPTSGLSNIFSTFQNNKTRIGSNRRRKITAGSYFRPRPNSLPTATTLPLRVWTSMNLELLTNAACSSLNSPIFCLVFASKMSGVWH